MSPKSRAKLKTQKPHSRGIISGKAFPHKILLVSFAVSFAAIGSYFLVTSRADLLTNTTKSGNWSDPTVWSTGVIPDSNTKITVKPGHNLTFNVPQSQVAGIKVEEGATLQFADAKSTTLESRANIIIEGKLIMHPSSPAVIQTLRFIGIIEDNFVGGGMDPLDTDVGLWVMGAGQLDIVGSNKTAWTTLNGETTKGATSIALKAAPVGWNVGDDLAIAPTQPPTVGAESFNGFDDNKVKSVTSNTVVLESPIVRDHPKVNNQWTAEVMNLSRNAQIEGTPTGRSHIFIRSTKPQTVNYLGIRYMGPRPPHVSTARPVGAEPRWPSPMQTFGRYGLHIHHSEDGSRGSTVTGTVVRDTGNHAFVPHASNGITFKDTITYNTIYDAYWWDGARLPTGCNLTNFRTCQLPADSTSDTLYQDCIAARVTAIGNSTRLSAFELGLGDRNSVNNCVAVGVGSGTDSSGFEWPEGAIGLWGFKGDIAHNNSNAGIFGWQNTDLDHKIENFDAYYNSNGIEHGAYTNHYLYTGGTLYGNQNTGVQLHAVSGGKAGVPLTFENMTIDSGGIGNSLIQTINHNAPTFTPTLFKNINFKAHNYLLHQNNSGKNPDVVDIVDSQLSGLTDKNDKTPSTSVIRIQNGGSAYAILPPGHFATNRATFVPEWNAYKLTTRPFYGVSTPSEDLIAPSTFIKGLDFNATISGVYKFRANILDNAIITKVEFYIDDILLDTKPNPASAFEYSYDTTQLVDGQHQAMMKVYDNTGNVGLGQFPFKSANDVTTPPTDTSAPSVPANLRTTAVIATKVDLAWNASTDNVGVTRYTVLRNGVIIGNATTTSFSDATVSSSQTYSYTVAASDAANNQSAQSTALRVTVPTTTVIDTTRPTTTITSPAGGAALSGTTPIKATATDNIGVTKVELYIDGQLAATDMATPYIFSWNTAGSTNATHSLVTKAYDAANNSASSATVTVTVNNTTAPKDGDLNGDGKIDIFDASVLLFNFGKSGRTRAQGDLNGDNVVNVFDASILLFRWGR